MAATKYTYSISTDFPNQKVSVYGLHVGIENSTITKALDFISISGDNCDIWFKDALTTAEETTLDGVVAAHDGTSPESEAPVAPDNKPYVTPDMFTGSEISQYCGRGDNETTGVPRSNTGGGNLWKISSSSVETPYQTFRFNTPVRLAGGSFVYKNASLGDWVSFYTFAPATTGTSNPGAGGYEKVAVGGGVNKYKVKAGDDWDLNLTETYNANVNFTKVVPVKNGSKTGQFNYDYKTEAVTVNSDCKGNWDLYDAELPLHGFVICAPILGDGHEMLTIPALRPHRILPHWYMKVTVNHSVASPTLDIAWRLFLAVEV